MKPLSKAVKLPGVEYFRQILLDSLAYIDKCDSHSDYHHELARWQERTRKWPQILDENGSL